MVRFGALKEEAQVRVAWVRRDGEDGPVGMGLTFAWPNEHLRNAIRRLIEEDSSPSPQQLSI